MTKIPLVSNNLFPIQLKYTNVASHFTSMSGEISKLWHDEYDHLIYGALKLLSKMKFVNDSPHIDQLNEVYEACQLEKQHGSPFLHKSSWRAIQPPQLIHSGLWGPIPVLSLGFSRYFISLIYDFSRKVWIYFLEKCDCFQAFKNFKAEVENFSEFSIKTLRTGRGTEYLSRDFEKLCRNLEIRHEVIVCYSPQQNGVCERKIEPL